VRRAALAASVLALLVLPGRAAAVSLQPVGTFNSPIYMTSPPGDPRLFVVERPGTIQVMHDGVTSQFLDISTMTTTDGERGLESMAFDPNYASSGLFYVFYTGDGTDSGGTLGDIHIDEYHVSPDPNVADPASRRTVWTFSHNIDHHNGGQLAFGKDGLLYISAGDNANGSNAQSAANPYGKIHRIDPHGAADGDHGVPSSNPFPSAGTPETWALGLRNPFRFSFDHLTGDLIIGDVGEGSREEVDFSPASSGGGSGANYEWPCLEGFTTGPGSCGSVGTMTDPVFDYPHSDPGGDLPHGCAIIGGFVYRGSQVPELFGRYLYTDLCNGELRSLQLGLPLASGDRVEGPVMTNPHSFGEDASCELYVTNGNVVDKIVGSQSGSATAACATAPPAATQAPPAETSCKRHKKQGRKAAAAKKRKKLCIRGSWASRL
jgi:glucose/arabinose dehydrogenase